MQNESAPALGSLVLLAGPPGAGKTSVAKLLTEGAERPTVHLHTDSFYVWIRTGFVLPYLPAAQRQNEVVTEVMVEAASGYARGGYDVVLDGILGPWLLEPFLARARRDALVISYVVLRPTLDIALARATAREGRALRDVEPITGLYRAFAALGALERHVVDSSAQTAEQTADALRAALRAGRFEMAR